MHSLGIGATVAEDLQDLRDETWRALTGEANAAFAAGDLVLAAQLYDDAWREAERLLGEELSRAGARLVGFTLVTISAHNVASSCARGGDTRRASEVLREAFERLVRIAGSDAHPAHVRAAAARNLQPALAELCADFVSRGVAEELTAILARAQSAIESVSAALHEDPLSLEDPHDAPQAPVHR